jgi:hypothetical protein
MNYMTTDLQFLLQITFPNTSQSLATRLSIILYTNVGYEVLTVVVMKSPVFWDIMPCSLLIANWCFGGTCHPLLQGQRICQARNQHEAGSKQSNWLAESLSSYRKIGGNRKTTHQFCERANGNWQVTLHPYWLTLFCEQANGNWSGYWGTANCVEF